MNSCFYFLLRTCKLFFQKCIKLLRNLFSGFNIWRKLWSKISIIRGRLEAALRRCSSFYLSFFILYSTLFYPLQSPISGGLGQLCKVHSFLPTFQFPSAPSHWPSHSKYKRFIKSIEFYLFRHKYWLNHLSAT